jgi:segregation and condensation protein B
MNQQHLKNIIEAALMAYDEPLDINQLVSLFEQDDIRPEKEEIRSVLNTLQEDYADRGIELKEVSSGFRFQARPDYANWINRLFQERPQRYSRAFMETLAIIAYRQPVTRGEIEDIRGVSVNYNIIKSMQEREWIRVVGHRDVPGKPELLATTKEFLDYFNLKKLSELPPLSDIKDYDQINPDLFEGLESKPDSEKTMNVSGSDEPVDEGDYVEDHTGEEVTKVSDQQEDNVVPFSG